MPNIGAAEIVIILVIALLVFGPKRLPEMGRSLGRGVREFKKASDTARKEFGVDEIEREIKDVKTTLGDVKGGLKVDIDAELSKSRPAAGAAAATPDDDVLVGEVVDHGSSDEAGEVPTGEAPIEEAVVEEAVLEVEATDAAADPGRA
jgi:TatA/E family protein of Tat protein translocase